MSTGTGGYVVVPTTMTFDLKGQQIVQNGGVLTVALRNGDDELATDSVGVVEGK